MLNVVTLSFSVTYSAHYAERRFSEKALNGLDCRCLHFRNCPSKSSREFGRFPVLVSLPWNAGDDVIKLFTVVIIVFLNDAIVFLPSTPF